MKFSEIQRESWNELQPYLDTAVIPVSGLSGGELPFEATEKLEQLRDLLDYIERPFHGRIVTYPAVQYMIQDVEAFQAHMSQLAANLKEAGFQYTVIVTAAKEAEDHLANCADLVIGPSWLEKERVEQAVRTAISELWHAS